MGADPDAMDTSALSLNSLKGGKKGPKGGCYNCGGNHFAKDCKKSKTGQSKDSKGKGRGGWGGGGSSPPSKGGGQGGGKGDGKAHGKSKGKKGDRGGKSKSTQH
eukprot:6042301-Pyramimonas_sp.AAC.1